MAVANHLLEVLPKLGLEVSQERITRPSGSTCPFFPGAQSRLHWSFEDPSKVEGSEEQRLEVFRRVRDGIKDRVQTELVNGGE